jgi:hypothetical protein
MTPKELESIKKKYLHHVSFSFSSNAKIHLTSSDLMQLSANIKKQLASKRDVEVVVIEKITQ